jgi:hypothetical protein
MKLIMPPSTQGIDHPINYFRNWQNWMELNSCSLMHRFKSLSRHDIDGEITGLRQINGSRFEVFLKADGKATGAIDWIIQEAQKMATKEELVTRDQVNEIRERVINYAMQEAKKDSRVRSGYEFQNFGLIFSFGNVEGQDVHIDLKDCTHFQFGMICSQGSHGTSEYRPIEPVMDGIANLNKVWSDVPPTLHHKLMANLAVQALLESYGCLLSDQEQVNSDSNVLPTGALLSLPGGVPHAAPGVSNGKFRSVLFFTGTPIGGTPYDVDVQFSKTTLVSDLLLLTWPELDWAEQKYLLTCWSNNCLAVDKNALASVVHRHLSQFGKWIQSKRNRKSELIACLASDTYWEKFPQNWDKDDSPLYPLPAQFRQKNKARK